jgi:hypothetical protein
MTAAAAAAAAAAAMKMKPHGPVTREGRRKSQERYRSDFKRSSAGDGGQASGECEEEKVAGRRDRECK